MLVFEVLKTMNEIAGKQLRAYQEKFGTHDKLIEFELPNNEKIYLVFYLPNEEEEIFETSILTLGLSESRTRTEELFELSFYYKDVGIFSEGNILNALIKIIREVYSESPLNLINNIFVKAELTNQLQLGIFLEDLIFEEIEIECEKIEKLILIINVFALRREEVGSLSNVPAKIRASVINYLEYPLNNSLEREPIYFIENAINYLWEEIVEWHTNNNSYLSRILKKNSKINPPDFTSIENLIDGAIPIDLRTSLQKLNLRLPLHDYEYLDDVSIVRNVEGMYSLSESGSIDNNHWKNSWLPFAEDSGGNMICIDLSPKSDQQIIYWEKEEGVVKSNYYSFFDWMLNYKKDLEANLYLVDDEGFLEER